jgi:hydrogenase maturation protease
VVDWRIIGCGAEMRGDDEAGLVVARHIKALGLDAEEHNGDGLDLLESWRHGEPTILIDAISSGARPGTIVTLDGQRPIPIAGAWRCSTHSIGIAQALEFGKAVGCLPSHLILYGIEGCQFAIGSTLSAEVLAACREVASRILELVRSGRIRGTTRPVHPARTRRF